VIAVDLVYEFLLVFSFPSFFKLWYFSKENGNYVAHGEDSMVLSQNCSLDSIASFLS
jgi:hypothetical protein